jgi:hypothetical protein
MKRLLVALFKARWSTRTWVLLTLGVVIQFPLSLVSFLGPQEPGLSWVGYGLVVGLAFSACGLVSACRDAWGRP